MTTATAMRLLPYEIHAMVGRRPCPRCETSGFYAGGQCLTCRGFAYLPTMKGRQLLEKVSVLIGGEIPIDAHGRFDEARLRIVRADGVRAGMMIREHYRQQDPYRLVIGVEWKADHALVVRLNSGYPISTSDSATFDRELSPAELERADIFIATALSVTDGGAQRLPE